MGEEMASYWGGGGLVHSINPDEQPLSAEPFSDLINRLAFPLDGIIPWTLSLDKGSLKKCQALLGER